MSFAFALGVIIYSLTAIVDAIKARNVSKWPTVEGMIITSKATPGDKDRFSLTPWNYEVEFSYMFDGKTHTANTLMIPPIPVVLDLNTKILARYLEEKYKKSSTAEVFVNPENPQEACLIPGIGFPSLVKAVLLPWGISLLWLAWTTWIV